MELENNIKLERMEKRLTYITILLFILGIGTFSCSKTEKEPKINNDISGGVPVITTMGTLNIPNDIQCDLYIFYKSNATDNYELKEKKELINQSVNKVKFMNSDLVNKFYRFLFIATPKNAKEIDVFSTQGGELEVGDLWQEMLIKIVNSDVSEKNYYNILDKTGEEILAEGTIRGELTRLVGQIVFDFYRTEDGTNPTDITSTDVESVMDRVSEINIEYSGLTSAIAFDDLKQIVTELKGQDSIVTQQSIPVLESNLSVKVPQISQLLDTTSYGAKGSVRVNGLYCLPSSSSVKVKMTFKYYDTTPFCGDNPDTPHAVSCFEQKELVLNLPQNSPSTEMLVRPNTFTVNKAGINFNRIIDLKMTGGMDLITVWFE